MDVSMDDFDWIGRSGPKTTTLPRASPSAAFLGVLCEQASLDPLSARALCPAENAPAVPSLSPPPPVPTYPGLSPAAFQLRTLQIASQWRPQASERASASPVNPVAVGRSVRGKARTLLAPLHHSPMPRSSLDPSARLPLGTPWPSSSTPMSKAAAAPPPVFHLRDLWSALPIPPVVEPDPPHAPVAIYGQNDRRRAGGVQVKIHIPITRAHSRAFSDVCMSRPSFVRLPGPPSRAKQ